MICCIQVVPDLAQVAMTMSSSRKRKSFQRVVWYSFSTMKEFHAVYLQARFTNEPPSRTVPFFTSPT